MQVTHSKTGVSLAAWSPDGKMLAFAAADEEPEKKDQAKFEDAFEVGNNGYLERSRPQPVHIWTIAATGGEAKRITSGAWSLPISFAPAGPRAQGSWAREFEEILFAENGTAFGVCTPTTCSNADLPSDALPA